MLTAWHAFPMLDRLFDDVMNDVTAKAFGTAAQSTSNPSVDVRVNDDELVYVCDVPGFKREDLEITVESGVLSVRGQRRYEDKQKKRVLRARSAFANSFALPDYVDAERMTAELADGVLTITVPRQPKAKPRRIQIGAGNGHKQLGEKKA